MKTSILLILFHLSFLTAAGQPISNDPNVVAETETGKVEGFIEDNVLKFLGIPFAQPPVGELRWKAPQPAIPWEGIKETKEFGPSPFQTNIFGDMEHRANEKSEDCLYLNVWTPIERAEESLPVLVYFYGGGLVAGDGSEPRYDGSSMAREGIVTVTVNYRLNIFGFLSHPQLSAEANYRASGNYGYLDQHAALDWVHKNIAAFGGDPARVTIAGESAGSISVSAQMASPLSRNLIAGAIGESGAAIPPTLAPVSLTEAEKIGVAFVENSGYESIGELRALSTQEVFDLYNKGNPFGFPGVIDGYFLPAPLPEIYNSGQQAQVPLLLGWNSAEMTGLSFMQGLDYTEENYIERVRQTYPEDHEKVLKLYPHATEEEIELSATALASDRFISYSTWKWFDLHRKNSEQPVYRYLYSKKRPPLANEDLESGLAGGTVTKAEDAPEPREAVGAPHAAEIEYFLGNLDLIDTYLWTEEDHRVSKTSMKYLANFIKTGNPNDENLLHWPAVEPKDPAPPVMVLDVNPRVKNAEKDNRYQFLDAMYENR